MPYQSRSYAHYWLNWRNVHAKLTHPKVNVSMTFSFDHHATYLPIIEHFIFVKRTL
jgi:hypothetical protein